MWFGSISIETQQNENNKETFLFKLGCKLHAFLFQKTWNIPFNKMQFFY